MLQFAKCNFIIAFSFFASFWQVETTTVHDSAEKRVADSVQNMDMENYVNFSEERVKTFVDMVEEDGNLQAIDAMEYREFLALDSAVDLIGNVLLKRGGRERKNISGKNLREEAEKIIKKFKDVKEQLDEKIFSFVKRNKKNFENFPMNTKMLKKYLANEEKFKEGVVQGRHQFVIACKLFIVELYSEGGELSWLDMHSFMGAKEYEQADVFGKIPLNKMYKKVYEISKYQSLTLDNLINATIFNRHIKNWQKRKVVQGRAGGIDELVGGGSGEIHGKHESGEKKPKESPNGLPQLLDRVIVEGAGPIGLYTAFQLFLGGNQVTLVNDRPETYLRNRVVFFDVKFMAVFRFLLGTEYNRLWVGPNAPGKFCCNNAFRKKISIHEKHNAGVTIGQINIRRVETALKLRLADLASFVENKCKCGGGQMPPCPLRLIYESALIKVEYPTEQVPHFRAIIGPPLKPTTNLEQAQFNEEIAKRHPDGEKGAIREKLVKIMEQIRRNPSTHLAREDEPIIPFVNAKGEQIKISPMEQAKLEFAGKAQEFKKSDAIEFDVLVCAGGANDRIRNEYLGAPIQTTIPKNYGVVVFQKSKFGQKIFKDPNLFLDEPIKDDDMGKILEELRFKEEIVESELLEKDIRRKYANIVEQIVKGLVVQKRYGAKYVSGVGYDQFEKDSNGHFVLKSGQEEPQLTIRLFETNPSVHIASVTPAPIEALFRDIDEQKKRHPEERVAYVEFRTNMERLWAVAVYKFCRQKMIEKEEKEKLGKGELVDSAVQIDMDIKGNRGGMFTEEEKRGQQVLEFDEHGMLNSATFSLVIWSAKNAVKELQNENAVSKGAPRAIIVAVGDANTSAHFMTSSGMSTGRLGVDHLVRLLRDYHQRKIESMPKLIEELGIKMNSVRKRVLKKATAFVEPIEAMEELENGDLVKATLMELANEHIQKIEVNDNQFSNSKAIVVASDAA